MGIQINGQIDDISATDGGLTISDLEINQSGISTFNAGVGIGDSIFHLGDDNTQIRFPAADTISFETGGGERLRITSAGKVGIGTENPSEKLSIENGNIFIRDTSDNASYIYFTHTPFANRRSYIGAVEGTGNSNSLVFATNLDGADAVEKVRIDSSGRLLIGLTTSQTTDSNAHSKLQVASSSGPNIALGNNSTDIDDDGRLGVINFNSNHGGTYHEVATIRSAADADHASNSKPSRLEFYTTSSGNTQATERLRIGASGNVGIDQNSPYYKLHLNFTDNNTTLSGGSAGNWGGNGIRIENDSTTAGAMSLIQFRVHSADWHIGNKFISSSPDKSDFVFIHEGTEEALRIKNDGDISVTDGNIIMAAGHGIDFSATGNANGTSNSELFHDYEEGTWTPASTTGMGTLSSTIQGNYIKIGSMCFIQFGFTTSSVSGSTSSQITGLPFTPADNNPSTGVENTGVIFHDDGFYFAWVNGGSSKIYIEAAEPIYGSVKTGSQHIRGSLYYHVA